ncbi:MAG TPA: hypothetical protein VGK94_07170 [Candidatus Polarisedimenticolia bacterium]
MMAVPVLDRGGTADRLRNHLRRRAITRPGLIEGDLYLLPWWRCSGLGPQGETSFYVLAAEVGDPRLHRANLPPADLKPFDASSLPAGARILEATQDERGVMARAAALGWRVDALEELIHYPFWLMRIEDSGRIEGGWIDGVEGRVIHHTLKVPPPVPSLKRCAWILAIPALLTGAVALAFGTGWPVPAAVVAIAAGPGTTRLLRRDARKERDG